MAFLGLAARVKKEVPFLRGVLLSDDGLSVIDSFEFTALPTEDLAEQIHGLASALQGRLSTMTSSLDRVIIRTGDESQGFGKKPIQTRTRVEGALLLVARTACTDVRLLRGPDVGRACGTNRDGAEAEASGLVAADYVVAASAALAAAKL